MVGASYFEVSWTYGISFATEYESFNKCLIAIDKALNNIKFPESVGDCHVESEKFIRLLKTHLKDVIEALYGIELAIRDPSSAEVRNSKEYYNRKGLFALCIHAAVTADCRFYLASAKYAGGTHDSTAIQSTILWALRT